MQRIQQGGTQETQPQVAVQQPQVVNQQVPEQEVEQQVVEPEPTDEILISQPGVKPINEVNVVNDDNINEDEIAEIAEELDGE